MQVKYKFNINCTLFHFSEQDAAQCYCYLLLSFYPLWLLPYFWELSIQAWVHILRKQYYIFLGFSLEWLKLYTIQSKLCKKTTKKKQSMLFNVSRTVVTNSPTPESCSLHHDNSTAYWGRVSFLFMPDAINHSASPPSNLVRYNIKLKFSAQQFHVSIFHLFQVPVPRPSSHTHPIHFYVSSSIHLEYNTPPPWPYWSFNEVLLLEAWMTEEIDPEESQKYLAFKGNASREDITGPKTIHI